mmetsp:Transcript_13784/g.25268  ORF Transcript_13784/g.25268 Transcript_13784/m.25268 type:complete len:186 (+) Transcript_13784:91-648(+)
MLTARVTDAFPMHLSPGMYGPSQGFPHQHSPVVGPSSYGARTGLRFPHSPSASPIPSPSGQGICRPADVPVGTTRPLKLADLALGEPLITDLLHPRPSVPQQQIDSEREYMRGIVEYMRLHGEPPRTQAIQVNRRGEVIGGNHRVLAAWLLGWQSIEATVVDAQAGWHDPLDERHRLPLQQHLRI